MTPEDLREEGLRLADERWESFLTLPDGWSEDPDSIRDMAIDREATQQVWAEPSA